MNYLKAIFFSLLTMWLFVGSDCNQKDKTPSMDTNGFPVGYGGHYIWSSGGNVVFPIVVIVRNKQGIQVHALKFKNANSDSLYDASNSDPGCEKTAPIAELYYQDTAATGYTYSASDRWGLTWNGAFDITAGVCHEDHLNGSCQIPFGTWKRLNDDQINHSAGVLIHWDGVNGIVTSNPGNSCYTVGENIWKQADSKSCTMEYWYPSSDCSTGQFVSANIKFSYLSSSTKPVLTVDGVQYERQE